MFGERQNIRVSYLLQYTIELFNVTSISMKIMRYFNCNLTILILPKCILTCANATSTFFDNGSINPLRDTISMI